MCIGLCCAPKVPDHFVGKWTDGKSANMDINANGRVEYTKATKSKTNKWKGPVRYSDNGFEGRVCFCFTIEGRYDGSNTQQPKFTIDGDVLNKVITQQPSRK